MTKKALPKVVKAKPAVTVAGTKLPVQPVLLPATESKQKLIGGCMFESPALPAVWDGVDRRAQPTDTAQDDAHYNKHPSGVEGIKLPVQPVVLKNVTVSPLGKELVAETEVKGGRTTYYLVLVTHPQREEQPPYQAECEDLIEALALTPDEANVFKEIWRSANARKGNGKPGHGALYGAQKIVHYAKRILRKREIEVSIDPTLADRRGK